MGGELWSFSQSTGKSPKMKVALTFVLFAVTVALGEVVTIYDCDTDPDVIENACQINQVRITPCKRPQGCVLTRGHEYGISIDFTPNFSTAKLGTAVYKAAVVDIPFAELSDANGCDYTTCPTEAGKEQQLNYGLQVSKKLPRGTFLIKWKIWNEENPQQLCCFKTSLKLK